MVFHKREQAEFKHVAASLISLTLFVAAIVGTLVPGHSAFANDSARVRIADIETSGSGLPVERADSGRPVSSESEQQIKVSAKPVVHSMVLAPERKPEATPLLIDDSIEDISVEVLGFDLDESDLFDNLPVETMVWPVNGAYNISSGFRDPSRGGSHNGQDIGTFNGTPPVVAAARGTVIFAEWDGGYGNTIEIDHGHGIVSRYSHLSVMTAQVGQVVEAGQQIGNAGSTGASSGNHLHFEILVYGMHVDPMGYLILEGS